MTTKIEQVATAISGAPFPSKDSIKKARAAIEALKITDRDIAVEQAGGDKLREYMEGGTFRYPVETAVAVYNAMLREILDEGDG